ncbi:extracellular solute-binding protein [Robinsoniella sp. KNHs210]|uniref:extracellular solute-binding protein n=1 Tax=Robinsoniella sp. KNHs210 TaxID=1469950 RepID=UPI0004807E27|nr:extracellular solute-binding protein [Robinsoniella sp. KNHs210]
MKKGLSVFLCAAMVTGTLAGCSSVSSNTSEQQKENTGNTQNTQNTENTENTKDTQNTKVTEKMESASVKIWHDGDEAIMKTIQDTVNKTLEKNKISVTFEKKTGLTDQIKLYGNDAENGPDMYLYAHDSLGTFVEMGVLAPITDVIGKEELENLLPMTVEAGVYKEKQYLLPVYFETLLFMYNKDLWQGDIPDTADGIYDYMKANTDTANGTYALVNQHSTAYNVSPFINGFGGYIINEKGEPGLNVKETKEAITYNKKFAELEADGDYNTVTTLFNDKKAAAIIGGPWLVSGIKDAGINLGIKSMSDIKLPNGKALAPYAGIQGVGVMEHAVKDKKDVIGKVLTAMLDVNLGIALAKDSNCAPANEKAYDDPDVAGNEMITAMKKTAQTAQPMPNIPEMSVMWGPAESLLAAVNKSGEDVDQAADKYQKEAESAISDMK